MEGDLLVDLDQYRRSCNIIPNLQIMLQHSLVLHDAAVDKRELEMLDVNDVRPSVQ